MMSDNVGHRTIFVRNCDYGCHHRVFYGISKKKKKFRATMGQSPFDEMVRYVQPINL